MSDLVRHTHWYNSGMNIMGVTNCFRVIVLVTLLVSVTNFPDKSILKKKAFMLLAVQGYSPSWWQKLEVASHIIYAVRKQGVITH